MAKWIRRIDDKGEYWEKRKVDFKNYIIVALVGLCTICFAVCVKKSQENYLLSQELAYYQTEPDYNQPQD